MPAFTFFATAEAVVALGATPVFCDVDPETWCMTAATAEPAITDRTRALLPVHIFGNPAPVPELLELAEPRRHPGARGRGPGARSRARRPMAGALAHAAAFSFFPSKNLGGFGDGGALTHRRRRGGGEPPGCCVPAARKDKRTFTEVGFNSRLDELQAAGLRVLLPHLAEWIEAGAARRAAYLEAGLGDLAQIQGETPDARSAWHILAIASDRARPDRGRARGRRASRRAPTTRSPLYRQPALERWAPAEPLAETERICSQILALPMGAALPEGAPGEVVDAIRSA